MTFREAAVDDVQQIQLIRNSVKENVLSNPALVPDEDVIDYISRRGKGWVCEADGKVVGFAIADLQEHNIWALFIHPDYEKMGIGKRLHNTMVDWYFSKTSHSLWLGTTPGTRAEGFYKKAGWRQAGLHGKGEIKFEMTLEEWGRNR